jgi:hypothetical protein
MINAYFACVNANGGSTATRSSSTSRPSRPTRRRSRPTPSSWSRPTTWSASSATARSSSARSTRSLLEELGIDEIDAGIAPSATRRRTAPRSTWARVQLRRRGAVRAGPARQQDRLRPVERPRHRLHRRRPRALAKAANVPIDPAHRERADHRRQLGRDQAGRRRRPERCGGAQLHPARGAGDPAGRAEARPGGPGQVWGCSTPCNTDFLAKSLGPKWNNKLFVNAELTPLDVTNTRPTDAAVQRDPQAVRLGVSGGIGSFSQMGFTIGEIATHALESITGAVHDRKASAPRSRRSRTTTPGMLCQGWTYGKLPRAHPEQHGLHGHPGQRQDRQASSGLHPDLAGDPQIAAYRAVAGTAPWPAPAFLS